MTDYQQQLEEMAPSVGPVEQPAERCAKEFAEPNYLTGQAVKAYRSQMSPKKRDEIILQYIPLVYRIVGEIVNYLHPSLSKEDLVSAGTIGLIKAVGNFDPAKNAEFKTYAYIRIRGSVLDELRGWTFSPPHSQKILKQVRSLSEEFFLKNGVFPTEEELAQRVGIEEAKLYQIFETARAGNFLSLNGMDSDGSSFEQFLAIDSKQSISAMEREELKSQMAQAIRELPEKQRQVILLYYHQELTMREVAEVVEVTEARVSQLHAAALFKMSTQLKLWSETK